MKKLVMLACIAVGAFSYAQDLEEQDDSVLMENNKNLLKIDVKEPFMQLKPDCANFKPASFDQGVNSYKTLLTNGMYRYLNSEYYTLNGEFIFTLHIDKTGKVKDVEGAPKVMNSEVFFDDMQYVVRRIKTNWTPATCSGAPIDSKMKIKINFNSTVVDM